MIPAYDDDSLGQPGELIILRNEVEGDEEFLVGIESEEEFNDVAAIFMKNLEDYYAFTE